MIHLTAVADADMAKAERIYLDSFPPEERRQWDMIAAKNDTPRLIGVYQDDVFSGILSVWYFADFVYIEHFAIDPTMRGSGIGAEAIVALKRQCCVPLVLEVEPPTHPDPMAQRRIAFYERCGFNMLDHDYVQPPYAPGLPAVPLRLMSTDSDIDPLRVEHALHRQVYGKTDG